MPDGDREQIEKLKKAFEYPDDEAVIPVERRREIVSRASRFIPEGGYETMPELTGDGILVAGDAACMCLAAGIWLEGVNFAIGSGEAAGRAVDEALATRPQTLRETPAPLEIAARPGPELSAVSCWLSALP